MKNEIENVVEQLKSQNYLFEAELFVVQLDGLNYSFNLDFDSVQLLLRYEMFFLAIEISSML